MSLIVWNGIACALFLGFTIWSFTLPSASITLYTFAFDTSVSPPSDLDYPQTLKPYGTTNIKPFVVLFFAITALAHLLYATDFGFVFRKGSPQGPYRSAVYGYGWNPYRWLEYSITASLMIWVISVVAGAKEWSTALLATLITPGLMFQGLTTERALHQNAIAKYSEGLRGKPKDDAIIVWANFLPAWLFFGLKWFIILNAYFVLDNELKAAGKAIDPRITQLVWIQFVGFSLFGIVQTVQVYGWVGPYRNFAATTYDYYEKAYIVLSFVAKAALGISVARLLS
jgi:hypothetical protein